MSKQDLQEIIKFSEKYGLSKYPFIIVSDMWVVYSKIKK